MLGYQSSHDAPQAHRLFVQVLMAVASFTVGTGYSVWPAPAATFAEACAVRSSATDAFQEKPAQAPDRQAKAPAVAARMTGSVKVDGTEDPIAGARFQISIGFVMGAGSRDERIVETDSNGRFTVELPEGNTRVWLSDPSPGYLVLSDQELTEDITVRPNQPIHREYHVRRGTIWTVQFTRGSKQTPFPGFVTAVPSMFSPRVATQAQADDRGIGLLTVTREGYAGVQAPVSLTDAEIDSPQVVDPIRLDSGVSLSGVVLDHLGRVVPGARVQSRQRSIRAGSTGPPGSSTTDENGRFSIPGLRPGVVMLYAFHEKVRASNFYLADGSPELVRIKLPERMNAPAVNPGAGPDEPLALGAPAPEWKVGPWSDRVPRKIADERGKVVVLYLWGMPFLQSVSVLPALGKVAAEFKPRNVEFLAIHSAEPDEETTREQGRRVLAFQGAPLAMAVDEAGIPARPRGATATLYGIGALPVLIVIDRAGKIAFRSDLSGPGNLIPVFREMVHSPKDMSEQQANEIVRRTLADEITKALNR